MGVWFCVELIADARQADPITRNLEGLKADEAYIQFF